MAEPRKKPPPRSSRLDLYSNEDYLASGPGTDPLRPGLTAEAIRLTRLIRALLPTMVRCPGYWR